MNLPDRIPFAYLLYCIPTDQYYYGCRYGKGVHPVTLWSCYFSSSKIVKSLIDEYGVNSFKFEIRKIFKNGNDAKRWETKVLRRMKVSIDDRWLNQYNIGCYDRKYKITYQDGKIEIIDCLHKFCILNGLFDSIMVRVAKHKLRSHKGFICDYYDTGKSPVRLPKILKYISNKLYEESEYTSYVKGVTFNSINNNWRIRLYENKKLKTFGTFDTKKEAEVICLELRKILYGG